MFKRNTKFDADLLSYSFSHFECDVHTVHMLTQKHISPPLTHTVKSSLLTHVHSSPLSLAARLQQCHTKRSHYINNGWTFSRQTSYIVSFVFQKYLISIYVSSIKLNIWYRMESKLDMGLSSQILWHQDK